MSFLLHLQDLPNKEAIKMMADVSGKICNGKDMANLALNLHINIGGRITDNFFLNAIIDNMNKLDSYPCG